ncbi:MAG: Asp-tRNA(Asn)/Glu-tRNA(Gln) amidotransferase subunit GatB [Thermoflexales bacterium]|nr:Asp-tRNA(Asn)/Glu-tRNA(Gln) amidotransferase subunit GatB [Thermoflexales bacterium]
MEYEVVIGMEMHVELNTTSKMFCACPARFFGAEPNTQTCPTCLGMPGALPTLNRRAIEDTVLLGMALNCQINTHTFWERKSYWYPDLPKGYQITQYEYPMCHDGAIDLDVRDLSNGWNDVSYAKRVRIRRAHLEEDTGKLTHAGDVSLVDYNRSGVPLVEIVTEPDIFSAHEAYAYLSAIQDIVRYLGIGTADMEKGALRCEPNLSLRPRGSSAFGTKVEIKNLNSLRAVRDSIAFEIERQTALLNAGGRVRQVTLGWDDARGVTVEQRSKEDAHDYRYFPEPDLPPLDIDAAWLGEIRSRLIELPLDKARRYQSALGLSAYDAAVLTSDPAIAAWFERAAGPSPTPARVKAAANWISTDLFRLMKGGVALADVKVQPEQLGELIDLVDAKTVNISTARSVFEEMFASGQSAGAIVAAKGLGQINDVATLSTVVDGVLAASPSQVAQYRAGQEKLFGYFVGQAMKATQGKGNAQVLNTLLRRALGAASQT